MIDTEELELRVAAKAVEFARNRSDNRPVRVAVKIGALSGADPLKIAVAVGRALRGTRLAGSAVRVDRLSVDICRENCAWAAPFDKYLPKCASCGRAAVEFEDL